MIKGFLGTRFRGPLAAGLLSIAVLVGIVSQPLEASAAPSSVAPVDSSLQATLSSQFLGCDPAGSTVSPATAQALSLVLPEAFTTNAAGVVVQASSFLQQAEVQSLNPLVVAYSILPNARWIDGRTIGLADFLATWKWGVKGSGPAVGQYRSILSIKKATVPHQVLVQFKQPTNSWRALFSPLLPATTPFQALAGCSTPDAALDLSGGPYVIASSSPSAMVLIKNPRWWGAPAPFSTLVLSGEINPTVDQFVGTDNYGIAEANWLPSQVIASIASSPGVSSHGAVSNQIVSLDFNTNAKGAVTLPLRRALAALINRPALVTQNVSPVNPEIAPAASHLFSQGQPGYVGPTAKSIATAVTTTTMPLRPSPELQTASRLLHKAGYQRVEGHWSTRTGKVLVVSLAVPFDDRWAATSASAIKTQLAAQGIQVRMTIVANSEAAAASLRSNRVMTAIIVRPSDLYLAHSAAWFTTSPGVAPVALWAGYQNRALNRLAMQAEQNMNPTDALPLYQQIDASLWNAMPSLPLFTEPSLLAWSTAVDGVAMNPFPPGTLSALLTWKLSQPTP